MAGLEATSHACYDWQVSRDCSFHWQRAAQSAIVNSSSHCSLRDRISQAAPSTTTAVCNPFRAGLRRWVGRSTVLTMVTMVGRSGITSNIKRHRHLCLERSFPVRPLSRHGYNPLRTGMGQWVSDYMWEGQISGANYGHYDWLVGCSACQLVAFDHVR